MNIVHFNLEADYSCDCEVVGIDNISQSLRFHNFTNADDIAYWREFLEDKASQLAEFFLEDTTIVKFSVASTAKYTAGYDDDGNPNESITASLNSKWPATLTRHHHNRAIKIDQAVGFIFDPQNKYNYVDSTAHTYDFGALEELESFTLVYTFPLDFHVNALTTAKRLIKCSISNYLEFLPFNSDFYCILHCLS